MNKFVVAAAAMMLASPALAESHSSEETMAPAGDIAAGEEAFNRQCVACHVVNDGDGEVLAGRNARTGPNLYALAGKTLGSEDGFRYGKSIVKLGESGMTWDEEKFVGYVQDPTQWLRDTLEDKKARGKMAFKVRKEEDAVDLYAYLYSLAPPAMEGDEAATN